MSIIHKDTILAFRRAKGMCECSRVYHGHNSRCRNPILWQSRGIRSRYGVLFGVWQVRHITSLRKGGENRLRNLEIVCAECYKGRRDYSRVRIKQ